VSQEEHQRPRPHDLPLLDGLRGVAALMIVVTHVGFETGATAHGSWGALVARLDLGVALFFVLSGFLLVRPWLRAAGQPSTRRYLLRRAARILPAYWVVLVVALLTTARGASAGAVASNAALLQVYTGDLLSGLTQTWSLCTEAAFYLVLPLLALLLVRCSRRQAALLLAAMAAAGWAWTALAAGGALPARAGTWLPGHLDWFAVGLALALVDQQLRERPESPVSRRLSELGRYPGTLLALAAAVFWLAATPVAGPRLLLPVAPGTAVLKEAMYALAAGLVLAAVAFAPQRGGPLAAALGSRPVAGWGRVSYGVFLWHLLVLAAVGNVLGLATFGGGFWRVLVLTVAGTLVVATASWHLLERPVLGRVHRRPLVPRPAPPQAEPAASAELRP
jgi:peptidoglycan/LPS O-acetylase OafA/YrhL